MRRRYLAVLLLCPGVAHADIRLDLEPIPELLYLEPAFHLDRGEDWDDRTASGMIGSLGLGAGSRDGDGSVTSEGSLALGKHSERWLAVASGELVTMGKLVRGHHHGLIELRTREDDHTGIGGVVGLQTTIDHGDARGLAPVKLGQGRHDNIELAGESLLHLGREKDDFIWVAEVFGAAGGTWWRDAPALDRAYRRSLGLGIGRTPSDGELPRGAIDLVRGRVEHATIMRPIAAAGAAIGNTEVRTIELGLGAHEMTLHIDHEMLAVITADVGWSWLEADTAAGRLADNMFRMRAGTSLVWRPERSGGVRRLGAAIAREPGYTPDGQRLVSDWRVELATGVEDRKYVFEASGGISWVRSIEGGLPTSMFARYGSHLEAFYKVGAGIELGAYHAATYEPQGAGDPWASPRTWGIEAGVLARWRHRPALPSPVRMHPCGGAMNDAEPQPEEPPLEIQPKLEPELDPEYVLPPELMPNVEAI